MHGFTTKNLIARHAILSGEPNNVKIIILMTPFLLDQEIIDTSICLDGVDLPSNILKELSDNTFEFPVNPTDGYIDGSIYLQGKHHPVDVSSLVFSKSRDGNLKLIVKGIYVLEFEGLDKLENTPFTLATPVSSCAV
jgi:hypothetical protein